jgi:hypothetical protein
MRASENLRLCSVGRRFGALGFAGVLLVVSVDCRSGGTQKGGPDVLPADGQAPLGADAGGADGPPATVGADATVGDTGLTRSGEVGTAASCPAAGTPCQGFQRCSFGDTLDIGCRTQLICTNGRWDGRITKGRVRRCELPLSGGGSAGRQFMSAGRSVLRVPGQILRLQRRLRGRRAPAQLPAACANLDLRGQLSTTWVPCAAATVRRSMFCRRHVLLVHGRLQEPGRPLRGRALVSDVRPARLSLRLNSTSRSLEAPVSAAIWTRTAGFLGRSRTRATTVDLESAWLRGISRISRELWPVSRLPDPA